MTVNVYLEPYIVDTLTMFGEFDEVVERVVTAYCQGDFEPATVARVNHCKHYIVDINSEDYELLVQAYGATSPRASLRRILHGFVDNEMYDALGWTPVSTNGLTDADKTKLSCYLSRAIHILQQRCIDTKVLEEYCDKQQIRIIRK